MGTSVAAFKLITKANSLPMCLSATDPLYIYQCLSHSGSSRVHRCGTQQGTAGRQHTCTCGASRCSTDGRQVSVARVHASVNKQELSHCYDGIISSDSAKVAVVAEPSVWSSYLCDARRLGGCTAPHQCWGGQTCRGASGAEQPRRGARLWQDSELRREGNETEATVSVSLDAAGEGRGARV